MTIPGRQSGSLSTIIRKRRRPIPTKSGSWGNIERAGGKAAGGRGGVIGVWDTGAFGGFGLAIRAAGLDGTMGGAGSGEGITGAETITSASGSSTEASSGIGASVAEVSIFGSGSGDVTTGGSIGLSSALGSGCAVSIGVSTRLTSAAGSGCVISMVPGPEGAITSRPGATGGSACVSRACHRALAHTKASSSCRYTQVRNFNKYTRA